MINLISKYNVAAPRYTSYPTVPYWDETPLTAEQWKQSVKNTFNATNKTDGISLYIHLPFCEKLCTYCACNKRITINHNVELPYINAVLKEWALYLEMFNDKPQIKEIHLGGGTPTFFSSENLTLLLTTILSGSTIHPDAEFSFEAHPTNTEVSHLQALYKLGFRRVSFGIQDFDPKVQEIINRVQTYKQVKYIVEEAKKTGYTSINFDLIYGLPLQTKASVMDTINQVKTLMPDRIAFYSYAHVPWVKSSGQRKFTEADLPVDVEKRILYETGRDLFLQAGYEEIGMDHFALKTDSLYTASVSGKLHRNFMGYTHHYTQLMIGLGASSISDTWNGYMQNLKIVEDYQAMLDKGELPLFKGHLLNEEDLILRKHILNIMCRFETSWNNKNEQCKGVYDAVERLSEMISDNLITLTPYHLKVTKEGRSFLRNICMTFDARLWRKTPATPIFSTTT